MLLVAVAAALLAAPGGQARASETASHLPDGQSPSLDIQSVTGDFIDDPTPNSDLRFVPPAAGEVNIEFTAPDVPQSDSGNVTIRGVNARESQNGGAFITLHDGRTDDPPTGLILGRVIRLDTTAPDPVRWRVDIQFSELPQDDRIEVFLMVIDNGGSATDNAELAQPLVFVAQPPLDLAVGITASNDSLEPGARITYTIIVINPEAVDQTASLRDDLDTDTAFVPADSDPAWTASSSSRLLAEVSVPAGSSTVLTLVVLVDVFVVYANKHQFDNAVQLTVPDFDNSNNAAAVAVQIFEFSLTTEVLDRGQSGPGDLLLYRDTVTNNRARTAPTTLTHTVPAGTTFSDASDGGWSCQGGDPAGTGCSRTVPLGTNGQDTFLFGVRIDPDHSPAEPINGRASLRTTGDLNPTNNTTSVTSAVRDDGPPPEPEPVATPERPVSFLNGFNFIIWTGPTMPVDDALGSFPNLGLVTAIFEFDGAIQAWNTFRPGFFANSIDQLVSGGAYVFSMTGAVIWQMPLADDLSGTQNISTGFPLIGWVGSNGSPDDLLDAIAQDRNVSALNRFNAQTQMYEPFRPGALAFLQGITSITQFDVFFVSATAPTSITQ